MLIVIGVLSVIVCIQGPKKFYGSRVARQRKERKAPGLVALPSAIENRNVCEVKLIFELRATKQKR